VLFTADAHAGLASGAITVTFRIWSRPQVKVGGRYKVGGGDLLLSVDSLEQVQVGSITDDDARSAGEADAAALAARLARRPGGRYTPAASHDVGPDTLVWRVGFHRVAPDGPSLAAQDDLSADDVADITRRLARLDTASSTGPWTMPTLSLIAARPGVVSTVLAEALGRDRPSFKVDVRKLKRLGLTESLEIGYRLSPRGQAFLTTNP
jgi:hypothetical protein